MSSYTKVMTGDSITIKRLVQLLEEKNIDFLVKDQTESARLAGFGAPPNAVELFVQETDMAKARTILEGQD
jgi:ribosomal protein L12E/L44/L45/RPP1/RPP2